MPRPIGLRLAILVTASMLPFAAMAQEQPPQPPPQPDASFDVSDAPVAAGPAQAAPQSQALSLVAVDVGLGAVNGANAWSGRYNGRTRNGLGVTGGWNIQTRDASDSGGTKFLSFTGEHVDYGFGLNAPEASVLFKTGQQGRWTLSAGYDAMTYTASSQFTTILDRQGQLSPGYMAALTANGAFLNNSPTGNLAGSSFYGAYKKNATTGITSTAGNHLALYGPQNELIDLVDTRRDKVMVGGDYLFGVWKLSGSISHEHKEGSLEQSMTTAGSNAGMIAFAMPVNYDTDIYSATATYSGQRLQAVLAYEFSDFRDNNSQGFAFQGWNFTSVQTSASPAAFTSYQISGNYSLPPNNTAQSISANVGYNATPTTRLNASLVYGLQKQDDRFVSPTLNGYTLANVGSQFTSNPASLNGKVQTFFGAISVVSRPLPKFDIQAKYSIDVRNPDTRAMWIYGDPTDAVDNTLNTKYRQAVPAGWTKQDASVSVAWKVLSNTKATLRYTYRDADRDNAITHHARDNEELIKLQSTFPSGALGMMDVTSSLTYLHADRTASAPDYSFWLAQIPSDCGATLAQLGCQQIPFYQAARTQDSVTAIFTGVVNEKTTLSLFAKYNANDYHNPAAIYNGTTNPSVGIDRDYSVQIAPDLTWLPDKETEFHLFYTFMRSYRDMRALNDQAAPTIANQFYYSVATTYDLQTAGVSLKRQINPKLKLSGEYIYSYGHQGFNQSGSFDTNEAGQTYGGDPRLTTASATHKVVLTGTYAYSPTLQLGLKYQFDSLDTSDWALVGATVGQVLTGDLPPKYNVSTLLAAVTWKF